MPLLTQSWIAERELRTRSLHGALAKFHLDALLGLIPIHTHGAERGLRREHEHMLARWFRANLGLRRMLVGLEAVQLAATTGLAAWFVIDHLLREPQASSTLLLCYWALSLPGIGREFGALWLSLPALRNATLRLLEPLGAVEEESPAEPAEGMESSGSAAGDGAERFTDPVTFASNGTGLRAAGVGASSSEEPGPPWPLPPPSSERAQLPGVALHLEGVRVRAAGHTLLDGLNLRVEPGEHIAILGASGAGKSTLLGLLLGWHQAAEGSVGVDGKHLRGEVLARLRQDTAWVDPGVQLWNRSLLDNLAYGQGPVTARSLGAALEQADLLELLEGLPSGLDESLGEGGGCLSGGEGQRVRLGRAFARKATRLVLLDEPFRGLDRGRRHELLLRTRDHFRRSTLLCVTHDVRETLAFGRVLVIENGRLVEDGAPTELLSRPDSAYQHLHRAEEHVQREIWGSRDWQRWTLSAQGLAVQEASE